MIFNPSRILTTLVKHISILLLIAFAGYSMNGITGNDSLPITDAVSMEKKCMGSVDAGQINPSDEFSAEQNLPLKDSRLGVVPCSSSVHLMMADLSFHFDAGEANFRLGTFSPTVSSLNFVYQEPDPPRKA